MFKKYFLIPISHLLLAGSLITTSMVAAAPEAKAVEASIEQNDVFYSQVQSYRDLIRIYTSGDVDVLTAFDKNMTLVHSYYLEQDGNFDFTPLLKAITFSASKQPSSSSLIESMDRTIKLFKDSQDINVLTASLLYPSEGITQEEIAENFGKEVASVVEQLRSNPDLFKNPKDIEKK